MLGERVGEENGRITLQRVLDAEGPKIETSFSASGTYRTIDVTDLGTYWTLQRTDGSLYGEGQGVVMTRDGEIAPWTAQGLGRFISPGTIRFRGSSFYRTSSTGGLAFLNNLMAVFEYQVNEVGNTTATSWEWSY
jgi:hypothetical protein